MAVEGSLVSGSATRFFVLLNGLARVLDNVGDCKPATGKPGDPRLDPGAEGPGDVTGDGRAEAASSRTFPRIRSISWYCRVFSTFLHSTIKLSVPIPPV